MFYECSCLLRRKALGSKFTVLFRKKVKKVSIFDQRPLRSIALGMRNQRVREKAIDSLLITKLDKNYSYRSESTGFEVAALID